MAKYSGILSLSHYSSTIYTLLRVVAFLLILSLPAIGQDEPKTVQVNYTNQEIVLDGILDEPAWQQADVAENFWQFFPTDSLGARYDTQVRMLYDETYLYVSVYAESAGDNYVVTSLRRDFGGASNDNVTLIFDTFSDGTNAFVFGVTPYGVQREVQVSEGGASGNGFNNAWDQKWRAEARHYEDHFTVEMIIPFSSVKFKEGSKSWRFRAYRWDIQTNEQSTWVRVPQNQLLSNLAFAGNMVFQEPLGKSRFPISVIPYINALSARDFNQEKPDNSLKFGGDAKIPIGTGMNLDLTVNPDFSNVEVDNLFTNLTRFEVFLPERRQFFIDNSDLFGNFGSRAALPFFSRRIGLARDTTGALIENRIIAGGRLSGKLDENWRLGFLNIQTDESVGNEIPSNNNMMLAVQRKIFNRSNFGFFFVNRQTLADYNFQEESEEYSRVIGADFNLATADNTWQGKFYLHKSFQPDDSKGNLSSQASLTFNTRFWQLSTDFVYVDKEFQSDLGFIPRRDIFRSNNSVTRIFYPNSDLFNTHSLSLSSSVVWRPELDMKKADHDFVLGYSLALKNQSSLNLNLTNSYIFLFNDFDPTRTPGGEPLPGDMGYEFNQLDVQISSNPAKLFTFSAQSTVGEFFNGNLFTIGGEMAMRFQPWAQVSLQFRYDQIRLPDPNPDADYWLWTPRVDITFSRKVFWSTLLQYSNQRDNIGINSRLQWRYAQLSDLYIVYNDNYSINELEPKFRSINLKLTYWLNL